MPQVSSQVCRVNQAPSKLLVNSQCVPRGSPSEIPFPSDSKCVRTPFPVINSKLPVYELLALSMAEAVMVRSLDLMDSYHTLSVSSSC